MKHILYILVSVSITLVGCQKVDPNLVLSLDSQQPDGVTPPPASQPANGRITLGSDSQVLENGGYKLKGRISTLTSSVMSNGGYKLKGTVRF